MYLDNSHLIISNSDIIKSNSKVMGGFLKAEMMSKIIIENVSISDNDCKMGYGGIFAII